MSDSTTTAIDSGRNRRRLRNYFLLDRDIQFKFAAVVAFVSVATAGTVTGVSTCI
jgi:hypothetical protein